MTVVWHVAWDTGKKESESVIAQLCLTLCKPMDCSPPDSSVQEASPGKNTGGDCHSLLWGGEVFPDPGIKPGSPTLQEVSSRWKRMIISIVIWLLGENTILV